MEVQHGCRLNGSMRLLGGTGTASRKHGWVTTRRHVRRSGVVVQTYASVRFRPCIDIHKGKVKQIVGSTLTDDDDDASSASRASDDGQQKEGVVLETNFESEKPAEYYADLYKKDGLTGGHIIMLGADAGSKSQAFGALEAYPGGMQIGGGVTTENARMYLDAGASHVIVTSLYSAMELSIEISCDEFLVHGVDVEGKKLGIDDDLVELLGKFSPVPVTYAGGASSLEDLDRVASKGQGRVDITVGSALDIFGGTLKYDDVVAWHASHHHTEESPSTYGDMQPDGTILYRF
eukprot:jgi/Picre1/35846/NNA_003306.t1